jgi:hypothetical protein
MLSLRPLKIDVTFKITIKYVFFLGEQCNCSKNMYLLKKKKKNLFNRFMLYNKGLY